MRGVHRRTRALPHYKRGAAWCAACQAGRTSIGIGMLRRVAEPFNPPAR
jgi:hypothetical protein